MKKNFFFQFFFVYMWNVQLLTLRILKKAKRDEEKRIREEERKKREEEKKKREEEREEERRKREAEREEKRQEKARKEEEKAEVKRKRAEEEAEKKREAEKEKSKQKSLLNFFGKPAGPSKTEGSGDAAAIPASGLASNDPKSDYERMFLPWSMHDH